NYGLILNALQRHGEAIESFDQAIKQKSKFAEAHNNRGATLSTVGRHEEAVESLRKAVAIKPYYTEAHYNLGTALRALGRYDEALKSFDRALALQPKDSGAHNNRGAVLEALGKLSDALACYERALALNPNHVDARKNRIHVLGALKRFDNAAALLDQRIGAAADDPEAYYDRGKVLIELNRNAEAAADFAKAVALRPDYAEARIASCMAELPILYADENEIAQCRAAYAGKLQALAADVAAGRLQGDLVKALDAKHPFLLAYQGQDDRDLQALYGAMGSGIVQRQFPDAAPLPPPPAPGEPIRVGVVSAFFNMHSNWKIPIKGWLSQFDRTRFKLFGYHVGRQRDAETEIAAAMCDRFVHRESDVAAWRREILADAPHVLIYPGLLMDTVTLPLAAQRLAPVQCNSWGHPETSGLATLDYFLSSDGMEPPDAQALYSEKLVRLPNLSIYYEPVAAVPIAVTRAEIGIREDAVAFWCGQSLYKYLPQYDRVFAQIAKRAPRAQFVFLRYGDGGPVNDLFEARLARAFAAEGLDAKNHCLHLARMTQDKFVAVTGQCDVFLDSIGWSGCNSALESLPHHLPIVTLEGGLMRARHSAAVLRMMGVTDTIAATLDDYVAIAARLATGDAERQALKARMREAEPKVYRDHSVITALEDLLERAVRG